MSPELIAFLSELAELLEKHKVYFTADDEWTGYAECGQDIQISLETDQYDTIKFGRYLDIETIKGILDKS